MLLRAPWDAVGSGIGLGELLGDLLEVIAHYGQGHRGAEGTAIAR
jgi:hypothetical protein